MVSKSVDICNSEDKVGRGRGEVDGKSVGRARGAEKSKRGGSPSRKDTTSGANDGDMVEGIQSPREEGKQLEGRDVNKFSFLKENHIRGN
jgi:hypothetical protein